MTRGGKRENAGRRIGSTKKDNKISKNFRLNRKHIKWLKAQKNMSRTIRRLIDKAMGEE